MKTQVCLPKFLLLTAALALAGTLSLPAASNPPTGRSGAKTATTPPPAAPAPEPTIPGFVINRTNGGFLSLLVDESGHFKLSFYDAQKKPAPVDVVRASARWSVRYKATDERVVLNPSADGTALTAPLVIRPPYIYRIFLSLFVEGSDESAEHYVVDFRQ